MLEDYDLAIFVSVNAVRAGVEFILNRREWPDSTRIATVGASSAEALLQYGLSVDLLPEHHYNSEALLALDELQDMSGQCVVIFRGNGGRELLRETLLARGADVDYVEVYQRKCPEVDENRMQALLQPGYLDCITITSNEALQNLFAMAGPEGRPMLLKIPLVVMGARQATLAQQLGFVHAPVIAANASDEAIVAAVQQC
jgi:uroporphyrinogen-III synthase